jgi:hypothetical protein
MGLSEKTLPLSGYAYRAASHFRELKSENELIDIQAIITHFRKFFIHSDS